MKPKDFNCLLKSIKQAGEIRKNMKTLRITFKDPDGVYDAIYEYVSKGLSHIKEISEEEKEKLRILRIETITKKLETFIKYSEYITIEFDLEAGTAKVIEN